MKFLTTGIVTGVLAVTLLMESRHHTWRNGHWMKVVNDAPVCVGELGMIGSCGDGDFAGTGWVGEPDIWWERDIGPYAGWIEHHRMLYMCPRYSAMQGCQR